MIWHLTLGEKERFYDAQAGVFDRKKLERFVIAGRKGLKDGLFWQLKTEKDIGLFERNLYYACDYHALSLGRCRSQEAVIPVLG